MKKYTGAVFDAVGRPQASLQVKVVLPGTTTLASIFSPPGTSIGNPLTTDLAGAFSFYAQSGTYDFLDSSNSPLQTGVQIYDLANPSEWFTLPFRMISSLTTSISWSLISAHAISTQFVTLTGASPGDDVIVTPTTALIGTFSWYGFVSSADTIGIVVANVGTSNATPATTTWRVTAIRHG